MSVIILAKSKWHIYFTLCIETVRKLLLNVSVIVGEDSLLVDAMGMLDPG